MPQLTTKDGVHVLDLGDTENVFSPEWMTGVEEALDAVAAEPLPLVTIASGKNYSQGLDLGYAMSNASELPAYTERVHAIFSRVLTLPVATVAAINGHAFGAGAILAMAHDWRIQREDRGYFCFPEVDIQIPFTTGMAALIQSKLTPQAAVAAMTTGRRFGGVDALAAGIVDATATESALLENAIALVAPLAGKPTDTLGKIKTTMYATAVAALAEKQA